MRTFFHLFELTAQIKKFLALLMVIADRRQAKQIFTTGIKEPILHSVAHHFLFLEFAVDLGYHFLLFFVLYNRSAI